VTGHCTIGTPLFPGQRPKETIDHEAGIRHIRSSTQELLAKKSDTATSNRTLAIMFSDGWYRYEGEIRCSAVEWNAGGRSDPGLDNFQHREHSPGAALWSRLCMWSRVISRKAVQTDLCQTDLFIAYSVLLASRITYRQLIFVVPIPTA
jgi:hypothetical protein